MIDLLGTPGWYTLTSAHITSDSFVIRRIDDNDTSKFELKNFIQI